MYDGFYREIQVCVREAVFFIMCALLLICSVLVRACFYFSYLAYFCPIGNSFCFSTVQHVTALYYEVVDAICGACDSVFVDFVSYANCGVYIRGAGLYTQRRSLVFLEQVCRRIFSLGVSFSTGQCFANSRFFVLRVIQDFRVFCFTFQMVVSRGLGQVGGDRRTQAFRFRILASTMFGRYVIGETIYFKCATRFCGRFSKFQYGSATTRYYSKGRAQVVPSICSTFLCRFLSVAFAYGCVYRVRFYGLGLLQ